MDRTKLYIGAYCLSKNASTEKHISDITACGIAFMVCVGYDERKTSDLFRQYGIGAIVSGVVPGWWGCNGNSGKMAESNPLPEYCAAAERFSDHPAILGIDAGDEPSAVAFGSLRGCCKILTILLFETVRGYAVFDGERSEKAGTGPKTGLL